VIRRLLAAVLIAWLLGLVLFAVTLPRALEGVRTDAVVVPTGAVGRIGRGLDVMEQGLAPQMLVTGVDRDVKRREFAAEYEVDPARMECCITLDYSALDTRGNATAAAEWITQRKYSSVRLVTSDWHMRRAAAEFRRLLPPGVKVVEDAVESRPSMRMLVLEYHKLLARQIERLWN
jgi:uncharacterized SAM-binding protein YcdF (DUF218 family)